MDTHEFVKLLTELGYGGVRIVNRSLNDMDAARLLDELRVQELPNQLVGTIRRLLRLHRKNLAANGWVQPPSAEPEAARLGETIRL
jgi:hypothetical protein